VRSDGDAALAMDVGDLAGDVLPPVDDASMPMAIRS